MSLGARAPAATAGRSLVPVLACESDADALAAYTVALAPIDTVASGAAALFEGVFESPPTPSEAELRERAGEVELLLAGAGLVGDPTGGPGAGDGDASPMIARSMVAYARAVDVLAPRHAVLVAPFHASASQRARDELAWFGYRVSRGAWSMRGRAFDVMVASRAFRVDVDAVISRPGSGGDVERLARAVVGELLGVR